MLCMFSYTFHIVLSCSPWAAGAARPTIDLEHFAPPGRAPLRWSPGLTSVPEERPWTLGLTSVPEADPRMTSRPRSHDVERRGGTSLPVQESNAICDRPALIDELENELNKSVNGLTVLAKACTPTCPYFILNRVAQRPLRIALKMYTTESLPFLEELLKDQSADVRLSATNTLVQAANDLAQAVLKRLIRQTLRDPDPNVQKSGARAIVVAVQKADKYVAVRGLLIEAMMSTCAGVRIEVAGPVFDVLVDKFDVEDVCGFTEKLMRDTSADVRDAAAETLATHIRNKSNAAIRSFQKTLSTSICTVPRSERGYDCPSAATAAGKPLVAALETLGSDAFPFLSSALSRKEPGVRKVAAGKALFLAVQNMTLNDARALAKPVMNDTDEEVLSSAAPAGAWIARMEAKEAEELARQSKEDARARQLQALVKKRAAVKAKESAEAAQAKAERAEQDATSRMIAAEEREKSATKAKESAEAAQAKAEQAEQDATSRMIAAEKREKAATNAKESAEAAQAKAEQAGSDAMKAKEIAVAARAKAERAEQNATSRMTAAMESLKSSSIEAARAEAKLEVFKGKEDALRESEKELEEQKVAARVEQKSEEMLKEKRETWNEWKMVVFGGAATFFAALVPFAFMALQYVAGRTDQQDPTTDEAGRAEERADGRPGGPGRAEEQASGPQ